MLEKIVKFTISAMLAVLAISCGSPAPASDAASSTTLSTHSTFHGTSATSSKTIVTAAGANKSATARAMNQQKIDPSLLIELERLEASGQLAQEVSVIIRTEGSVNSEQQSIIETNGGKINSVIGDVLAVLIPAGNISAIADLKFVLYVEKSKKQKLR